VHGDTHIHTLQEPVAKGGFRAMAEELARDINRHATVVLGGSRTLEQHSTAKSSQASTSSAAPSSSAEKVCFWVYACACSYACACEFFVYVHVLLRSFPYCCFC